MTTILDLAVVVLAARAGGALCKAVRQPVVVGEILAGLVLGIVLGSLSKDLAAQLLPAGARDVLDIIGKTGLVLFAFAAGLAFDIARAGSKRTVMTISLSSVLIPFGLGVLLAIDLWRQPMGPGAADPGFLPFALFIGTATATTAFPVLARILVERNIQRTPLGVLALACAAVNDMLGWSILAAVLAIVASDGAWDLPRIMLESLAFVAVLLLVVRPLVLRPLVARYERAGRLEPLVLAAALVMTGVSAWITDAIGVHVMFGAFAFGAAWPRTSEPFRREVERRLDPAILTLLPVFFVLPGLSIDLGALGVGAVGDLALILLVGTAGKYVSTAVAARSRGMGRRDSVALGALMNTRGVMELVVLNIGLTAGIIAPRLYAVFIIMALVTTAATGPALDRLYPDGFGLGELPWTKTPAPPEPGLATVGAAGPTRE